KKAIPLTQPSAKGRGKTLCFVGRVSPLSRLAEACSLSIWEVCVYRGRDGALRRARRVHRRNERAIDFTPSIPRLNGAGATQRTALSLPPVVSDPLNRYLGEG